MAKRIEDKDLIGLEFGDLTVLSVIGRFSNCIKVLCRCKICNRENEYWYKDIKNGIGNKHYMCSSRLEKDAIFYKLRNTHSKIKDRCENANNFRYSEYGARGIYHEFEHFIDFYDYAKPLLLDAMKVVSDMYKLSIDRIDNNGGYVRGNLRFTTQDVQVKNSRKILNRRVVFYNTKEKCGYIFDGKTTEEIAKTMGWTERSTRSRIGEKKYLEWEIYVEKIEGNTK